MTVECYRVVGFQQLSDDRIEVETYSLGPDNTNIKDLLRLAAPSIRRESSPGLSTDIADLEGDHSARYEVAPDEMADALALLESHREPVVTAIDTGCDVSVCLDFYAHPAVDAPDEWEHTVIGSFVREAKYWSRNDAQQECCRLAVSYVERHPVLQRLTGVAAVPGSAGVTRRLLNLVSRAVSAKFDVPIVDLRRTHKTKPQKNLEKDDDHDGNQRGTMEAMITGNPGLIVIVDDLMARGSTVREAGRALRAAGAQRIASLALAKNRTGTREYAFDEN